MSDDELDTLTMTLEGRGPFSLSLTDCRGEALGILAPSPIEEYLMFIHMDHDDDMNPADRKAAREITGECF